MDSAKLTTIAALRRGAATIMPRRAAIGLAGSLAGIFLAGCSSVPPPQKQAEAPPPPPPVKDDTGLLLAENRVSAAVVNDHLFGKQVLPGGTLGEYENHGKKYQIFIMETTSSQNAAILLLDFKTTLMDAAYIAYMGGYFGTDAGKPVYVFAKLQYLAGVAGLPQDLADPIARQLAARLL
jgi:hypothetical protein